MNNEFYKALNRNANENAYIIVMLAVIIFMFFIFTILHMDKKFKEIKDQQFDIYTNLINLQVKVYKAK